MDRKVELGSSNSDQAIRDAMKNLKRSLDVPMEPVTDAPDLDAAVSLSVIHDEAESEAFWKNYFRPASRVALTENRIDS